MGFSHDTFEIKAYVDMVVASLPVSADRTDQIKQETEKDEIMKELKVAIQAMHVI